MTFHSVLQVIFCKISAYKQVYTYVRCMQFPARMIVLSFLQRKCKLLLGCCKICDLNFLSHFFPSCTLLQFLLHALLPTRRPPLAFQFRYSFSVIRRCAIMLRPLVHSHSCQFCVTFSQNAWNDVSTRFPFALVKLAYISSKTHVEFKGRNCHFP